MPAQQKKPNPIDNILRNISRLPPTVDLMIAAGAAAYALFAIFLDNQRAVGLGAMLVALIFAVFGIVSLMREMKLSKIVVQNSSPDVLLNMQNKQFEAYLITLFNLAGYDVRLAIDEISRADDADLIATKKKELILVQYNHFDDDNLNMRSIQSLQKAGTALRATSCVAISFGHISQEVANWGARKGVQIMGLQEVMAYAAKLTGVSEIQAPQALATDLPEEQPAASREEQHISGGGNRYLFVDFEGVADGISHLRDVLAQHPSYRVVASKRPPGTTVDEIRTNLVQFEDRLVGELDADTPSGRYFAIQHYLSGTPEGKSAPWLAIDSEPRLYPEGCSELVAINKAFGFDRSASARLSEAIAITDRRLQASVQC